MKVDLSKCAYYSGANAFKNDSAVYTGSLAFPTSATAGATVFNTTTISLNSTPQFSKFYADFQEVTDATSSLGIGVQWYAAQVAYGSVAVQVTTAPYTGYVGGFLYPIINGAPFSGTMTIRAELHNPNPATVSFAPLTVQFAFIVYTLAN